MRKFTLSIPPVLAALPATAHEGLHLHPHGTEAAMLALAVVLVAAVAAPFVWPRR